MFTSHEVYICTSLLHPCCSPPRQWPPFRPPALTPFFNMSAPYPYVLPPGQERDSAQSRRRENAVQPPHLLTSALGHARNVGLGIGAANQTPISATTLSSPFSGRHQSPYPASASGSARDGSPMALRPAGGFNAPYNPQQWGPAGNESPATSTAPHGQRPPVQSVRAPTFAPRPVGPDGELSTSVMPNRGVE